MRFQQLIYQVARCKDVKDSSVLLTYMAKPPRRLEAVLRGANCEAIRELKGEALQPTGRRARD